MNGCRQTDDTMPPFFLAVLCSYQRSQTWFYFLFFLPFRQPETFRIRKHPTSVQLRWLGGERRNPVVIVLKVTPLWTPDAGRFEKQCIKHSSTFIFFPPPPSNASFSTSSKLLSQLPETAHSLTAPRSGHAEVKGQGSTSIPKRSGTAELVFKPNRVLPHHPHSSSLVITKRPKLKTSGLFCHVDFSVSLNSPPKTKFSSVSSTVEAQVCQYL